MTTIGAIDIGSNAMRLAIATVSSRGIIREVETLRDPVRLGSEVFSGVPISAATMERAVESIKQFRRVMRKWNVSTYRAVATSALREASNAHQFVHRVAAATGIDIHVISGEEEARLIHRAVSHAVDLQRRFALLIDIGGGSAEVSVVKGDTILAAETFALGAVRLLHAFRGQGAKPEDFEKLVSEYTASARRRLSKEIASRRLTLCVGTGGNLECLLDLRKRILGKPDSVYLNSDELHEIVNALKGISPAQRIRRFGLRADRADVILPAAMVLSHLLELSGLKRVRIPGVGVREGILWDLVPMALGKQSVLDERQAVFSARDMGERFRYDASHAAGVAQFAMQLFDATRSIHRLGPKERVFLEVAALLHDVGHVVSSPGHHKHAAYLIGASPLIGLDDEQKMLVAMIVRYHRKSLPKASHDNYHALPPRQRKLILQLSSLLRVADAMDSEHAGRVRKLRCVRSSGKLTLHLSGKGDLLLERWAIERTAEIFESVFHLTLDIHS